MGIGSITHSLVWLGLVACYDAPPEIQLHVSRPSDAYNLFTRVCNEAGKCTCQKAPGASAAEDSLFLGGGDAKTKTRDLAIYIHDDSKTVVVSQRIDHDGTLTESCYVVQVGASMLERTVDLAAAEPWDCSDGACQLIMCTTTCKP